MLALVLVVICAFVAVPLLTYTTGVTRQSRMPFEKLTRVEAASGGLRTALLNPVQLYERCSASTATIGVALPAVDLGGSVRATTTCYALSAERREPVDQQRLALATTLVGAVPPSGPWVTGNPYTAPTSAPDAWIGASRPTISPESIWLPELPQRNALPPVSPTGYRMSATCTAFLPGVYDGPVVVTGPSPVYFASGVYYFEEPVTFGRNANVVIGEGVTPGCTTDLQAATTAVNGPQQHQVSGGGATFVFGRNGRLSIADAGSTGAVSVVFNQRYPAQNRRATDTTKGISIMSVNGAADGVSSFVDPGLQQVPASRVVGDPPTSLLAHEYEPVIASPTPLVSIDLTTSRKVTIAIPGYVAVPQGSVSVSTTNRNQKDVLIGGGVLARTIDVSPTVPWSFELGITNPIDLYTFRLVTVGTSGNDTATSTATVRVRNDGLTGITAWEVRS